METNVEIVFRYDSPRIAEIIARSLSPDNIKTPSNLEIKTFSDGNLVITKIKGDLRLESLLATLNDLIFCTQVAQKTVKLGEKTSV